MQDEEKKPAYHRHSPGQTAAHRRFLAILAYRFGAVLAAFLLLPVPVYAVLVFGSTWTSTGTSGWNISGSTPNTLNILIPTTPDSGNDNFVFTNTVTGVKDDEITAVFSNTGHLVLDAPKLRIKVNVSGRGNIYNTQFTSAGAIVVDPSDVDTLTLNNSNTRTITVTFDFNDNATWHGNSAITPFRITFGPP